MLTKSGKSIESLLNDVFVADGYLTLTLRVPLEVRNYVGSDMLPMAQHISERMSLDKKPSATYSKVLEQIEAERDYLVELYTRLFTTYQRAIDDAPKVRTSSKDKAIVDMLSLMPDKMLRDFAALTLGDEANDFILPSEREKLIAAYVAVGKNADSHGSE